MKRCRRGLTLLEVLLATVLLAAIAAACVPVLGHAAKLAQAQPGDSVRVTELGLAVDALLADPEMFDPAQLDGGQMQHMSWPEDDEVHPAISVQRLDAGEPFEENETPHAWLVFTCRGVSVCRWMEVDEEPEPGQEAAP